MSAVEPDKDIASRYRAFGEVGWTEALWVRRTIECLIQPFTSLHNHGSSIDRSTIKVH